jgi:glycosyltransferase involved in cell wall biosynthesis
VHGLSIEERVPAAQIAEILAGSDALLLHLRDEPLFRITIPSKAQAYLASGRPVVAGVGGEAAGLLRRSGAALVVRPSDPSALSEAISAIADLPRERREAMGRAGRGFYFENLSFAAGMSATLATIDAARLRACG